MHVDQKAPQEIHDTVEALVGCYNQKFNSDNNEDGGGDRVFVIKNPISVYWGHISVLDADLVFLGQICPD